MNNYFEKYEKHKKILIANKNSLEDMLEKEIEKYENLKNSEIDKKEKRLELSEKTIAIRKNALKKIKDKLAFLRPSNEEDVSYRLRQYDNFSKMVKEVVPSDLPLRFHGCPIYTAKEILQDGEISSSVDRLGVETSYDVSDQVSVTTKDTIDTTIQGYTGLTGDYDIPAGCVFVLLPKDKEDEKAGESLLMGNVNFKEEPERLFSIITSPENIESLKKWAKESGVNINKIYDFDSFVQIFNKEKKETINDKQNEFIQSLKVNVSQEVTYKQNIFTQANLMKREDNRDEK